MKKLSLLLMALVLVFGCVMSSMAAAAEKPESCQ